MLRALIIALIPSGLLGLTGCPGDCIPPPPPIPFQCGGLTRADPPDLLDEAAAALTAGDYVAIEAGPGALLCALRLGGDLECVDRDPLPGVSRFAVGDEICSLDFDGRLSCDFDPDPSPDRRFDEVATQGRGWCALDRAAEELVCGGNFGRNMTPDGTPLPFPAIGLAVTDGVACGLEGDVVRCIDLGVRPSGWPVSDSGLLRVPRSTGWIDLEADNARFCALSQEGEVTCWGAEEETWASGRDAIDFDTRDGKTCALTPTSVPCSYTEDALETDSPVEIEVLGEAGWVVRSLDGSLEFGHGI